MEIRSKYPALAVMLLTVLSSCGNKEEKTVKAVPSKVIVHEISTSHQKQELVYSGTIEPDNVAQIGFAVPGIVKHISVQEGQKITKGQLLASLDASEYVNALAIADAGYEQAVDMYNRLDGLYKKGSLPEKDFIDIKTKLAQAKANKSINAKHIADSKLYAPMSGIITVKSIEQGSTAAPGIPAFTIIKTDQVYAKVAVPESEVGSLKMGTTVDIFVPTLKKTFKGKISIINPQADAVSKTYSVKVRLANVDGSLLPGMLAQTKIGTGKMIDQISIPTKAIMQDADGLTYVFVANENKKAIRTRVTIGNALGNNELLIQNGLLKGQKVIISGQSNLRDGADISL
eukprot:GDKJ01012403.1.p3 GENE.GDKJ01012403.1~~GDKJ01012403.1.p3  ORF type:complete len:344 (-),score=21.58 GDKJ01012403.1:240-1271(-)